MHNHLGGTFFAPRRMQGPNGLEPSRTTIPGELACLAGCDSLTALKAAQHLGSRAVGPKGRARRAGSRGWGGHCRGLTGSRAASSQPGNMTCLSTPARHNPWRWCAARVAAVATRVPVLAKQPSCGGGPTCQQPSSPLSNHVQHQHDTSRNSLVVFKQPPVKPHTAPA